MKYIILISILFSYILSANDTLPELNKQLINGQFSFSGTTIINMAGGKSTCDFQGKTSSTTFECSWEMLGMKGSVKIDGDKSVINNEEATAEIAIVDSGVQSGGSASFMYDTWKGDTSNLFPNKNIKVSKNKGLTTVTGELRERSLKIILKDGQILSIESVVDPKKLAANILNLTDEEIIEDLKAEGKEITPEAISEVKQTLEAYKPFLQLKDKITMKTVIKITKP